MFWMPRMRFLGSRACAERRAGLRLSGPLGTAASRRDAASSRSVAHSTQREHTTHPALSAEHQVRESEIRNASQRHFITSASQRVRGDGSAAADARADDHDHRRLHGGLARLRGGHHGGTSRIHQIHSLLRSPARPAQRRKPRDPLPLRPAHRRRARSLRPSLRRAPTASATAATTTRK